MSQNDPVIFSSLFCNQHSKAKRDADNWRSPLEPALAPAQRFVIR